MVDESHDLHLGAFEDSPLREKRALAASASPSFFTIVTSGESDAVVFRITLPPFLHCTTSHSVTAAHAYGSLSAPGPLKTWSEAPGQGSMSWSGLYTGGRKILLQLKLFPQILRSRLTIAHDEMRA